MGSVLESVFGENKRLILSATSTLLDSFGQENASYYRLGFLLPAFLFLAFIGMRKRSIASVILVSLLAPLAVFRLRLFLEHLQSDTVEGAFKGGLGKAIRGLALAQDNMPVVASCVLAFSTLAVLCVRHASILFHGFIGILYYDAVFSVHASQAYFNFWAFVATLLTLSVVSLLVISATLRRLAAATLFGFSGVWGLLHLSLDFFDLGQKGVPTRVLDDIFEGNLLDTKECTLFFLMSLASSLFSQYSIELLLKASKPRGRVQKEKLSGHIKK